MDFMFSATHFLEVNVNANRVRTVLVALKTTAIH